MRRLDHRIAARFLAALLLCAAALGAFAEPKLPVIRLHVGPHPLQVEVAATEPERRTGLMNRDTLGGDEGMLFVFDDPGYYTFWMKNTRIPLSIAFVDSEGTILNILEMQPRTLDTHGAAGPALYAIEANKGWFAAHGIKAGDKVRGLPKPAR